MLDKFCLSSNCTEVGENAGTECMEEGGTSLGPSFRNSNNCLGSTPKKVQKTMVKRVYAAL